MVCLNRWGPADSSLCTDAVQGKMMKPSKELATSEELQEAAFSIVKASQRDVPRAKPYYMQLLRWLKEGLHAGEAYTQRSAIFAAANCFLQVCLPDLLNIHVYQGVLHSYLNLCSGAVKLYSRICLLNHTPWILNKMSLLEYKSTAR